MDKPDRAHKPSVSKLRHSAPCLIERDAGVVRPVQEVDVEVVAPKTREAVTARLQDLLASKAASSARHPGAGATFDAMRKSSSMRRRAGPITDSFRVSR